jgi:signal transduction histidine kinase
LAICYSIVTRAGGEISARSDGGATGVATKHPTESATGEDDSSWGTTITVLLPLLLQGAAAEVRA